MLVPAAATPPSTTQTQASSVGRHLPEVTDVRIVCLWSRAQLTQAGSPAQALPTPASPGSMLLSRFQAGPAPDETRRMRYCHHLLRQHSLQAADYLKD